jgi:hypothetical protein
MTDTPRVAAIVAEMIAKWRQQAQTHRNYQQHRDDPYDDVGHEHGVKAHVIDLKASELEAALSAASVPHGATQALEAVGELSTAAPVPAPTKKVTSLPMGMPGEPGHDQWGYPLALLVDVPVPAPTAETLSLHEWDELDRELYRLEKHNWDNANTHTALFWQRVAAKLRRLSQAGPLPASGHDPRCCYCKACAPRDADGLLTSHLQGVAAGEAIARDVAKEQE